MGRESGALLSERKGGGGGKYSQTGAHELRLSLNLFVQSHKHFEDYFVSLGDL